MANIQVKALPREKFLERIRLRGEEEAKRIIAEAEAEARRIIGEAREKASIEAKSEADRIIKEAREKALTIKRIAEAQARLAYRLRILEEKNKLIEMVFDKAKARLNEVASSVEYRDILENLIIEAAIAIGGGHLKVILPRPCQIDLDNIAATLERETGVKTRFELVLEHSNFSGGVIVTSVDGKVVYDNTFEGRMKRMKKDIIKGVALILFPGEKESIKR